VKGNLAGDLTIRGKDGDDRITLDVVAAASTLLDGGNANDTLDETNVLFNARVVQGMEVLV
jgi:Ca2+-binding RTX toxin-like protein